MFSVTSSVINTNLLDTTLLGNFYPFRSSYRFILTLKSKSSPNVQYFEITSWKYEPASFIALVRQPENKPLMPMLIILRKIALI